MSEISTDTLIATTSVVSTPVVSAPIALIGSPNAGKTTLFNWLTGSKFKTVNYPGSTIDYSIANLAERFGGGLRIMDTPGTYSLFPKSEDEEVTIKAIFEHPQYGAVSRVIVVVDATQAVRHLLLVEQLKQCGFEVVVALTMSDLIRSSGQITNIEKLEKSIGVKVIPIDGVLGGGVQQLVDALRVLPNTAKPKAIPKWSETELINQLKKNESIVQEIFTITGKKNISEANEEIWSVTRRLDRWFLHPIVGPLLFVLIMISLFSSIFWLASPVMDFVDKTFSSAAAFVADHSNGSLIGSFFGKGVITSFGSVMVFVPQIFILFLGISILESSGYLARAAALIDKPLSKLGMGGRSFVPLLSGFACAVPAIMATRNISSKRDRWITAFIIPLLSCSARLPVYSLLLGFLFRNEPSWKSGIAMAGIYIGSLIIGVIAAKILEQIITKNQPSLFMMELPLFRKPNPKVILNHAWTKTMGYVKRAGPPIFIFALLIWAGTTFPNYNADSDQVKLQTSYIGKVGQYIEPVFKPMGVDWRVGVGLITAFAAREVFVSSMAVIFNLTSTDEESLKSSLLDTMGKATKSDGTLLFTFGSVMGLLIFFMIALQCTSTTAIAFKEMGSWKFALTQVVVFNLVAYVLAATIYHIF